MKTIVSFINYEKSNGEVNKEASMTKPDMTYTVKEILSRWASGKPIMGTNDHVYTGEANTPDLRKMDLTEIEALAKENQRSIELRLKEYEDYKRKEQIRKKEQAEAASKKQAEILAAIEELKKRGGVQPTPAL